MSDKSVKIYKLDPLEIQVKLRFFGHHFQIIFGKFSFVQSELTLRFNFISTIDASPRSVAHLCIRSREAARHKSA